MATLVNHREFLLHMCLGEQTLDRKSLQMLKFKNYNEIQSNPINVMEIGQVFCIILALTLPDACSVGDQYIMLKCF